MKYFNEYKRDKIMTELELSNEEYETMKTDLKWIIYCYAVKENLYKEIREQF
jgi:hypoxanthine phosphoribosyltransferase